MNLPIATNVTGLPDGPWQTLLTHAFHILDDMQLHRGDIATARDLFDLALVIEKEPDQLRTAAPFLSKHSGVFLDQLKQRKTLIQAQFEAIDSLTFKPSFEHAFAVASQFLRSL